MNTTQHANGRSFTSIAENGRMAHHEARASNVGVDKQNYALHRLETHIKQKLN
jgi:hypothetical protein